MLHQPQMSLQGHRAAPLSLVSCTAWHFEISDKKSWTCPHLNFVSSFQAGHIPCFCCTLGCMKCTAAIFSISDGERWRQRAPPWVSTEQNLPSHPAVTVIPWVAVAKHPVNGAGDWIAQSPWRFVMMLQCFLQIIWKKICALNHAFYSMLTVLPILTVSIH